MLHDSVSGASSLRCVLKFACRDMTYLQLANQIGLFFSSTTHCELTFKVSMPQSGCFIIQLPRPVLRVYWLGYLPGTGAHHPERATYLFSCNGVFTSKVIFRYTFPAN